MQPRRKVMERRSKSRFLPQEIGIIYRRTICLYLKSFYVLCAVLIKLNDLLIVSIFLCVYSSSVFCCLDYFNDISIFAFSVPDPIDEIDVDKIDSSGISMCLYREQKFTFSCNILFRISLILAFLSIAPFRVSPLVRCVNNRCTVKEKRT